MNDATKLVEAMAAAIEPDLFKGGSDKWRGSHIVAKRDLVRGKVRAALTAAEPWFAQARAEGREEAAKVLDAMWGEAAQKIESGAANNLRWREQAAFADRARIAIRALPSPPADAPAPLSTDGQ